MHACVRSDLLVYLNITLVDSINLSEILVEIELHACVHIYSYTHDLFAALF
jgi:hypothetical protein